MSGIYGGWHTPIENTVTQPVPLGNSFYVPDETTLITPQEKVVRDPTLKQQQRLTVLEAIGLNTFSGKVRKGVMHQGRVVHYPQIEYMEPRHARFCDSTLDLPDRAYHPPQ